MSKKQTSNATRTLIEQRFTRDQKYAVMLAEIIKDFTDCPKCKEGNFCLPRPCITSYGLAGTLTTLKKETRRGNTKWTTTQATRELKNFERHSRFLSMIYKIDED